MIGNGLALVLTEGTGKGALVKLILEYIHKVHTINLSQPEAACVVSFLMCVSLT